MSENYYDEDGTQILRTATSAPLYIDNEPFSLYNIEVGMEPGTALVSGTGSDPSLEMRVSRDGGFTYGSWMSRSVGQIGEYSKRVLWNRLGQARSFVLQFRASDPIKWILLAVTATIEAQDEKDNR